MTGDLVGAATFAGSLTTALSLAMFWAMTSNRVRSASSAAVVLGRLEMKFIIKQFRICP